MELYDSAVEATAPDAAAAAAAAALAGLAAQNALACSRRSVARMDGHVNTT